jgi:hypothetical protein
MAQEITQEEIIQSIKEEVRQEKEVRPPLSFLSSEFAKEIGVGTKKAISLLKGYEKQDKVRKIKIPKKDSAGRTQKVPGWQWIPEKWVSNGKS